MRAGKEEESKAMGGGPMFPRLHVNDTASKGGPRAPPRNKMALYEQLSVPSHSQRFTSSSSASTRPPHHNSSTQKGGGVQERPLFSSFNVPTRLPAHSSDKVNHQSNDAPSLSPTGTEPERRPIKLVRRELLSSSKQSTAPDSSSRQTREDNSSSRQNRMELGSKRPVEDDDFMVPTLFNQTKTTDKGLLGQDSGDKSAKLFRLLPRFSAENSNKNSKSLERGENCSKPEPQKRERKEGMEGKGGRDKEDLDVLHGGFVEETMLGISVSPDDVVGAIGHKTFWKARRLIVNQQRVFAVQVFELHRLLKVQKLIAASPDVLLQSDPLPGKKLPIKPVPAIGSNLIAQSEGSKHSDERTMTTDIPECSKETPVLGIENNTSYQEPLPSLEEASAPSQARSTAAVSSVALPVPPPENNPSHSSCLPPTPNQWLVPVMSPSEGLVYKPYTGSYPPAGSFMSPFFPGCMAPVPIPTATGDFMNSAYGVPVPMPVPVAPHPSQNMGAVGLPNYFPPFGMQVMNHNPGVITNPVMSTSAVEQVSHFVGSKPDGTVRAEQHSRGSCNMVQMKSDAFSGCMWGFRASKDSEVQGSTASSPFDRGDALPFFQMGSASLDASLPKPSASGGAGNTTRVIKVVPHNPQLATQSAARIFQSIQKERKQNDT